MCRLASHRDTRPPRFRPFFGSILPGVTSDAIADSATVVVAPDVLGSELGSEVVMLSLRDGTYYGLDEVGAEIWRLVQAPTTIASIVSSLMDTYDVDAQRCRADVVSMVRVMRERGLVEVRDTA